VKALSLTQPWAWLVIRPDVVDPVQRRALWSADEIKGIENRRWNTKFRGEFLVHAAKAMKADDYDDACMFALQVGGMALANRIPAPKDLERGGIVGVARLSTVIHPLRPLEMAQRLAWHMAEQYGFVLGASRPLPFVACRGALGFWEVPVGTLADLERQRAYPHLDALETSHVQL
jgi:hypothetical protein